MNFLNHVFSISAMLAVIIGVKLPLSAQLIGDGRSVEYEYSENDLFVMSPVILQLIEDDPAFDKHVEWQTLAAASRLADADGLIDIALQLVEAERILMRKHRGGVTADNVVSLATAVSVLSGDKAALQRLGEAAKRLGNADWASSVEVARSLNSPSRSIGPSVAITEVDTSTAHLMERLNEAVEVAFVTNSRTDLETLKAEVEQDESLAPEIRKHIISEIDDTLKGIDDEPDAMQFIWSQLSAESRSHIDVRTRRHWSGMTYGQLAEKFFAEVVFPRSLQASKWGVTFRINRDNVICERFASNGRGGYWITCRARYSASVSVLGQRRQFAADRVRVYYENGGISVDLGGVKGALNTRGISKWVNDNLPKDMNNSASQSSNPTGLLGTKPKTTFPKIPKSPF